MTPALSKTAIQAFESSPATAFANQLQTDPQKKEQCSAKMQ